MTDAARLDTIRTDRLTLRRPTMADFAAHQAFYASDRAVTLGGPVSTAEAWTLFAKHAGHWALKGFGWFILDDGTGARGLVGVHRPPHYEAMELGWALYDNAEGKGYATEAATAIRQWALAALAPSRLVSFIDPSNRASQAVARRLGAQTNGTRARHNPDCEVWDHPVTAP